jgi:hypothetical protein
MKNKSGAALARDRAHSYRLFDFVDARERLVMVGHHVIGSEISIQLDCVETVRTRISANGMNDEIQVVRELFDFGMVTSSATIFYRQWMKLEDVQKDVVVSLSRCFKVYPEDDIFILDQIRNECNFVGFLDLISAVSVDEDVHDCSSSKAIALDQLWADCYHTELLVARTPLECDGLPSLW